MNEETFKAVIELDRDLVRQGYPLFMRVQAAKMMGQAMDELRDFDDAMKRTTEILTRGLRPNPAITAKEFIKQQPGCGNCSVSHHDGRTVLTAYCDDCRKKANGRRGDVIHHPTPEGLG